MTIRHKISISFSDGFEISDQLVSQKEIDFPVQTELEFIGKHVKRLCLSGDRNPHDIVGLKIDSELK